MQQFETTKPRPRSAVPSVMNHQDRGDGIGLMTVPEAATALRLTRKAVYALIWRGALAYVRIGRRIRIRREQLVGFVQERTVPSSSTGDHSRNAPSSTERRNTHVAAGQSGRRTEGEHRHPHTQSVRGLVGL